MKRRRRPAPRAAELSTLEAEDRAQLEAAKAYLERTRGTYATAFREARALGPIGHGVLAGPMAKRRSRAGRGGDGTP